MTGLCLKSGFNWADIDDDNDLMVPLPPRTNDFAVSDVPESTPARPKEVAAGGSGPYMASSASSLSSSAPSLKGAQLAARDKLRQTLQQFGSKMTLEDLYRRSSWRLHFATALGDLDKFLEGQQDHFKLEAYPKCASGIMVQLQVNQVEDVARALFDMGGWPTGNSPLKSSSGMMLGSAPQGRQVVTF